MSLERLQALLDEGVLDEIHNQLKTGKEAEVWLVSHHGEPVAAKLYKEREFRSFKNDAAYKEGRTVRNSRTQRAMDKGSKFGREASELAWKSAEVDAMFALHAAGVRCPKPVLFYDGVLLMEVIGDAEGRVAPRLVEAGIAKEQAGALYLQLRAEVIKMLAADWIHGDLSEFNILMGANGPVIIDFPQVVTAAKNSKSEQFFRRDLGNVLRFCASFDASLTQRYASDADEIWRAYVRRYLRADFEPRPGGSRPESRPGGERGRFNNSGRPPSSGQPNRNQGPSGAPTQSQNSGQPGRDGGGRNREWRGGGRDQRNANQRQGSGDQRNANQRQGGGDQRNANQRGAGGDQQRPGASGNPRQQNQRPPGQNQRQPQQQRRGPEVIIKRHPGSS